MKTGYYLDLQRARYGKAHELQHKLHNLRAAEKIPDTLIFLEHDPVITRGRSAKDTSLLVPEPLLKERGVELFSVERGGDFTFHGPGQLVGYPVFLLERGLGDIRGFVYSLERSLAEVLGQFGISAVPSQDLEKGSPVGVWVGRNKIAALGIAVRNKVTYHGFALNVNTDLSYFNLIIPCGLVDRGVTSMEKQLGQKIDLQEVKNKLKKIMERNFSINPEERDEKWIKSLENLPG